MPCTDVGNPGDGCFATAGTALICACPSPDPFPDEVIRTPVALVVAGCAALVGGITVACSNGGFDYPFENAGDDIVEQAREIQAAIDRLFEQLNETMNGNRRREIMEAIERLREALNDLFN